MFRKGSYLEFLTKGQLSEIHHATLHVLEHTGISVELEEALKLLDELGAVVDYREKRVRIPPSLVEEALKKTPSSFVMYARDPEFNLPIENDRVHLLEGGLPLHTLDLDGNHRLSTLKDVADFTRLYDALENVDMLAAGVFPSDIPETVHHAHVYLTKLENTGKVCFYAYFARGGIVARDLIEMASIVAGSLDSLRKKPLIMGWENPISPLAHGRTQTEMVLEFARHGLPIHIGPAVQSGSTGPISLAGVLVQQNAEILSGVVIAQSVSEPGRNSPIVYGAVPALTDMRQGTTVYGSAESALMNVASYQLARYYGIPCRGNGGVTESKIPDMQAGYESAITLLMAALGGANLIMNATGGSLEPGVGAMSFEKAVIDDEIAGMVARILRGIEVSDETLAVEIMDNVGPLGHYFTQEHTRMLFEREHRVPKISDRRVYQS